MGFRGQQGSLADSSSWLSWIGEGKGGKGWREKDGRCWEAREGMGLQLLQPDTKQLAVPCCAMGLSQGRDPAWHQRSCSNPPPFLHLVELLNVEMLYSRELPAATAPLGCPAPVLLLSWCCSLCPARLCWDDPTSRATSNVLVRWDRPAQQGLHFRVFCFPVLCWM